MLEGIPDPVRAPQLGRFFALGIRPLALLGSLALVLSWLAPNHYPPWTSFHNEAAAIAAVCLLVLARAMQPGALRAGKFFILFLPLALLVTLQWAGGLILYGGDALLSGVFLFGAALAFWLGENSRADREPDPLTWLATLVVGGAAVDVFVGVLQWHQLEQSWGIFAADRGPSMRVFSNLAQPNHLATLCLMAIVLLLWLRIRRVLRTWQFVALLAWLSLGVTLSESRSGLVGATAVGIVLLCGRRHIDGLKTIVLSWWAGLATGFLLLPIVNRALYLAAGREAGLGQDSDRFTMWRQALVAIGDSPWFGHGWRQTLSALKQAASQAPGTLATDYAHNVVLDVLVWVGVPLGLVLVAGVAFWMLRAWRRVADARQLVLLAAAVPVIVHSQFEFPFAYAYFLFPVAWLLGALSTSQSADREISTSAGSSAALKVGIVTMVACYAALCSAIALEYLRAEEDYRVMRFELRKVGRVPFGYEAPDLVLLTQLREKLQMGRVEPKPAMPPELLKRLRDASARDGWATLDLTYAAALAMNGQPTEASRQLALLRSVYGEESASQAFTMFRAFSAMHPELTRVPLP